MPVSHCLKKYLLIVLLAGFSCQAFAAPVIIVKSHISHLFIQAAQSADLQYDRQAGNYKFTLHEVSNEVTYFTTEPARISGTMPLQRFLKLWQIGTANNSHIYDALNAGVVAIDLKTGKTVDFVITIAKPAYNINTHTITYLVNPISEKQAYPLLGKNISFKHVGLFIGDGWCASCAASGF